MDRGPEGGYSTLLDPAPNPNLLLLLGKCTFVWTILGSRQATSVPDIGDDSDLRSYVQAGR